MMGRPAIGIDLGGTTFEGACGYGISATTAETIVTKIPAPRPARRRSLTDARSPGSPSTPAPACDSCSPLCWW